MVRRRDFVEIGGKVIIKNSEKINTEGYQKVSQHMRDNVDELLDEANN